MDRIINPRLMGEPINWIIIPLIVFFVLQCFTLVSNSTSHTEA